MQQINAITIPNSSSNLRLVCLVVGMCVCVCFPKQFTSWGPPTCSYEGKHCQRFICLWRHLGTHTKFGRENKRDHKGHRDHKGYNDFIPKSTGAETKES